MDGKKIINQLLIERGMTLSQLAERIGMQPQSLRNKLNRDAYSLKDFVMMLDALDSEIRVVTRDTMKEFY